MNFQTHIDIPKAAYEITHHTKIMLFGSCFSENIGQRLTDNKMNALVNPYGILYNPFSVAKAVTSILHNELLSEDNIAFHNGLYHSFLHHGRFSHTDKTVFEANIRDERAKAHAFLQKNDVYIFTFGTAFVYRLKKTNQIVGNCHKFPSENFRRTRVTPEDIIVEWERVLRALLQINPNARFIFTVSPIRHWKDGAHQNQLSKSILLLAIDTLMRQFPQHIDYFPSYELVMDELRDYRFYAEDMLHLSPTSIDYIWQRFGETYFSPKTHAVIAEWQKLQKAVHHRLINPKNEETRRFFSQTLLKLEQFQAQNPFIDCSSEHHYLLKSIHNNEL